MMSYRNLQSNPSKMKIKTHDSESRGQEEAAVRDE